jgi:hypothetical protein
MVNQTNLETVANSKYRNTKIKYGWVNVRRAGVIDGVW